MGHEFPSQGCWRTCSNQRCWNSESRCWRAHFSTKDCCSGYLSLEPTTIPKQSVELAATGRMLTNLYRAVWLWSHDWDHRGRGQASAMKEMRTQAGVGRSWWGRQFSDLVLAFIFVSSVEGINPSTAGPGSWLEVCYPKHLAGRARVEQGHSRSSVKWVLSRVRLEKHIAK